MNEIKSDNTLIYKTGYIGILDVDVILKLTVKMRFVKLLKGTMMQD